jgi:L-serine dehydratase
MKAGRLRDGGALNRIILYVTALMEVKSAMGVIVAAPTAGACAALPGAVIAMAETLGLGEEEMAKAMQRADRARSGCHRKWPSKRRIEWSWPGPGPHF